MTVDEEFQGDIEDTFEMFEAVRKHIVKAFMAYYTDFREELEDEDKAMQAALALTPRPQEVLEMIASMVDLDLTDVGSFDDIWKE